MSARDEQGLAPRIVVAGFGNPLRADDGVGWWAASLLHEWWEAQPVSDEVRAAVRITAGHQPLPEWAPLLATAEVAFFIDAVQLKDSDHAVALQPIGPRKRSDTPAAPPLLDGHSLGLEGLLELTYALFGHAPEAYLVTVPAQRFSFSDSLSSRTETAMQEAVKLVQGAVLAALSAAKPGPDRSGAAETARARAA